MEVQVIYYLDTTSSWCCWAEPLIATIDGMLSDATAYASWKVHIGDPPQG